MEPLQNPRHEQFALLVASGKSLSEAFVAAGYSKANAASCALRLSKKPEVRSRIAELQQIVIQVTTTQAALDRSWVLSELRKIAENGASESARVRALELCGKELGMFAAPSDLPWDGDPATLTDPQLEKLELYLERIVYGDDRAALEAAKPKALQKAGLQVIDLDSIRAETRKESDEVSSPAATQTKGNKPEES
jgi:hypothetical protein